MPGPSPPMQAIHLSQELLDAREVEFVDIATDKFSNGETREDLVSMKFILVLKILVWPYGGGMFLKFCLW